MGMSDWPFATRCDGDFWVVPYECVTANGLPLHDLFVEFQSRNYQASYFALIAPSGRAVDSEFGGVQIYRSLDDAIADASTLQRFGECSTCGGGVWKRGGVSC